MCSPLHHSKRVVKYHEMWIEPYSDAELDEARRISEKDASQRSFEEEDIVLRLENPFQGTLYLRMDLCEFTLAQWIAGRNKLLFEKFEDERERLQNVNFYDVFDIFRDIFTGLLQLRDEGPSYYHGDLSPNNVFLNRSPAGCYAKIGDLGQIRSSSKTFNQYSPVSAYSQCYSAPEVSEQNFDHMSDFFSLGFLLFEMMYPFKAEDEYKMDEFRDNLKENHILPPLLVETHKSFSECILKLTEHDVGDRPGHEELWEFLESVQATRDYGEDSIRPKYAGRRHSI